MGIYLFMLCIYIAHDITLVGDNVMLVAWEVKSVSKLTQAGYNGANSEKWPTFCRSK